MVQQSPLYLTAKILLEIVVVVKLMKTKCSKLLIEMMAHKSQKWNEMKFFSHATESLKRN
jgi:hypothetical protein